MLIAADPAACLPIEIGLESANDVCMDRNTNGAFGALGLVDEQSKHAWRPP
jgi:hypothetical protein